MDTKYPGGMVGGVPAFNPANTAQVEQSNAQHALAVRDGVIADLKAQLVAEQAAHHTLQQRYDAMVQENDNRLAAYRASGPDGLDEDERREDTRDWQTRQDEWSARAERNNWPGSDRL